MSFLKTFVLLTFSLLPSLYAHKCVHNQVDFPLQKTPGSSYPYPYAHQDLIMVFDYTNLESANPEVQTYIKDVLLPPIQSLLEKSLKVGRYRTPKRFSVSSDMCNGLINIPYSARKDGYEADLVIFVAAINDPSADYMTKSMSCGIETYSSRPTVGTIIFNTALMNLDMKNTTIDSDLSIVLHEMTHILGFSKALYSKYVDPTSHQPLIGHILNKILNGVETMILDLPPLTQRLRAHFRCSTLEGAYLENEGGPDSFGAHFERRIFYNEIMTSNGKRDARFSEFTLAFLEGTGWYKADYSYAEPMAYGMHEGCKFFDTKCVDPETKEANFRGFCSPLTRLGVSWDKRSFGVCGTAKPETSSSLVKDFDYWGNNTVVIDKFADNCPQIQAFEEFDCEDVDQAKSAKLGSYEYYGPQSKAFIGTLSLDSEPLSAPSGYCFKTLCTPIRNDFSLMIKVGDKYVYCTEGIAGRIYPSDFGFPNNMKGYLECPDPYDFCDQVRTEGPCKKSCFGNGQCSSDGCKCADGWGSYNCIKKEMVDNCQGCWYEPYKKTCYGNECICNPSNITCQCLAGLKTGNDCKKIDNNNVVKEEEKVPESKAPSIIFAIVMIVLVTVAFVFLQILSNKKKASTINNALSHPIMISNEQNQPQAHAEVL